MSEEQKTQEAWREVGRRFEALGQSLAEAIRAAWKGEDTQRHVAAAEDAAGKMVDRIDQEIERAASSEQAKRVREEAEKAAESARVAGERTWQDARPQLISALSRVNAELERVIQRLEQEETDPGEGSGAERSAASPETTTREGEDQP